MIKNAVKKPRLSVASRMAPCLVLALILAASVWLWRFWVNHETTMARDHFNEYCEQISRGIIERLNTYKMILHGGAGVFIASEEVNREEWRAYYEYHQVRTLFPGIQGIAFVKVVAPSELARHEESIRAEGFPEYTVWPAGERALYTPIVFIEPFDARNRQALGYDGFSEPVRRAAMERARDTATTAMSDSIRLVQEPAEDVQAGFLLYVPVFDGGLPQTGVEERRAALTGYVFAALRVKDFMRSIFAEVPEKVAFELYDGATVAPEALLFESSELDGGSGKEHRARFSSHTPLELYGYTWSLAFRSTPQFEAGQAPYQPWIVLVAGLVVSILILLLMRAQQSIVAKAAALAVRLTVDLRKSEQRFEQSTRHSRTFVWETDAEGLYTYASAAVEDLLGYRPEELVGKKTIYDLHPEEGREEFRTVAAKIMADTKSFFNLENRVQTKSGAVIWVSSSGIPLLGAEGNLIAHLGSDTDITKRKQSEDALRQRIAFEQLVHEVSTMALVEDDLAAFLDRCLALFGERLGVDRAYFFRHDEASDTMSNTHEWCAEGIAPQQDKLQGIPGSDFLWWVQTLRRNEVICYSDIEEIPDEAAKQILRDQDIKSILVVPLFINGQYYGFLGFDDCSRRRGWQQENIDILLSLSRIVNMVTERRRVEDELRESRETLHTTLYSIGDAMISTDAKGLVVSMNPVAESLTGWSEQEAIGQPLATVFRIVNEHTGQPVESPARRVLKEGVIVGLANHTLLLARDGRKIPIADSGAPIRNAAGEIAGVVLVFRDQTEERTAQLALEDSRQRLESMFRAAPVGIGLACSDIITRVNDLLCKITGYSHDELIGQSIRMLYPSQEEFERCGFGKGEQIERIGTEAIETVWQQKDGMTVDVLFGVSPLDRRDPGNGVTFVARDITEHKKAEADRIARQEAEQANRAKSVFLANMSHEIRTPLNAMLGFAQILEHDPSLTPRQTGMIHTIGRSGRHLLDLINDILDMSKIEAGRLELSSAEFCLHDLLDDLEMMFDSPALAKQLSLSVKRDDLVPRYINADEAKLRQVLINLMGNAVKFTKTGGIAVRVRCETTAGSADDANTVRLVVEVEDSGLGIAEDELARIFEPFRQLAAGREAGGTGLGLAVSRRLVELMGGSLTVKSQVGKGSCFRFDALVTPVEGSAQEDVRAARQVVGLEPGPGPVRILIVDDEKDNRDLLAALLEPVGFEIREAVNGQEALEVFEGWSPHAVLMDIRMPVMDGYEATRRIKATEQGHATPVIAVTASAFEDSESKVMATGVDGYVCKPFKMEKLLEVLKKCLGLRYVYADTGGQAPEQAKVQPLTREDLAALPEALRQALRQAVDEGDMAGLKALIAQVEKMDAEAARKLWNLADQYDYEALTQLLAKQ